MKMTFKKAGNVPSPRSAPCACDVDGMVSAVLQLVKTLHPGKYEEKVSSV
jgi:hypothetical protein